MGMFCCAHAGIGNLVDITNYLLPLDTTAVCRLGLVLGLNFNRLMAMKDSPTFLEDMLSGWLQRAPPVVQTEVPTWARLVEALKDPRVGQNGLASKIEEGKLHGKYHTYQFLRWPHTIYICNTYAINLG